MKNILIASFDLEVGGVERSLISMLNNFNYKKYNVDLMLYSHTGDFLNLLPDNPNLLEECEYYKTFRMSIFQIIKSKKFTLGLVRILAKLLGIFSKSKESGYKQMQYMWKFTLPFLPKAKKKYDVAISYLWPHYFVAEKVDANTKIAWIHTDYSVIETDIDMDIKMWDKYDHIVAVSEECKKSFINKYPYLNSKVIVIENITSPEFVKKLAKQEIKNDIKNDNRFKIITVARLSYAKGIDNAIKALKLLTERGIKNIAWYVVGYGGDENKIKKLICKNNLEDNFILLGKKINPYPYIREANLYVQPSRYEGKAVTVIEAQILSKPVMITNYSTAQSQVNNGIDGHICEMSIEGLAEGIEKLYQDSNLRSVLISNCQMKDYNNNIELEKLYKLF